MKSYFISYCVQICCHNDVIDKVLGIGDGYYWRYLVLFITYSILKTTCNRKENLPVTEAMMFPTYVSKISVILYLFISLNCTALS
jgi:hypothetical protein